MSKTIDIKLGQVDGQEQANSILYNKPCDFACFTENPTFYSGGRYYNLFLFTALNQLGYNVKIFTNRLPVFYNDLNTDYKVPEHIICNISTSLAPLANTYIGTPFMAAEYVLKQAALYKKCCYIVFYDSIQELVKTSVVNSLNFGIGKGESSVNTECMNQLNLRDAIRTYQDSIPKLKLIVCNDIFTENISTFFGIPQDDIVCIKPCLNSRVADAIRQGERENWFIAINRNDKRKDWGETLRIFSQYQDKYHLHIITNSDNGFSFLLKEEGIDTEKVSIHVGIADFEKFRLLSKSKVQLSNSKFEGFGMFIQEPIYMGTPVVCYDLPSLKNETHPLLFKSKDIYDFQANVDKALTLKNEPDTTWYNYKSFELNVGARVLNEKRCGLRQYYYPSTTNVKDITCLAYNSKPPILHFNSIFKQSIYKSSTANPNPRIFNDLVKYCESIRKPLSLPSNVGLFTVSNHIDSILNHCCLLHGLPLQVVGQDIKAFKLKYKITEAIKFIESSNYEKYLFLDSDDVIIVDDLLCLDNYLLDKVIFGAEAKFHPPNEAVEQLFINNIREDKESPFQFLNSGMYFGYRGKILEVLHLAKDLEVYESTYQGYEDSDQGRLNQVYLKRSDLIKLDKKAKLFYCNDLLTNALTTLNINYDYKQ